MTVFLNTLFDNPAVYLVSLVLCLLLIFAFARPTILAWFDPWAFQQIFTVFASATVLFMGIFEIIELDLLLYHLFATIFFLIFATLGFKLGIFKILINRPVHEASLNTLRNLLFISFIIFQLTAWIAAGLPLLLDSRLDAYAKGDGLGILSRILSFLSFASLFLTVLRIGITGRGMPNFIDIMVILFSITTSVLNAAKSGIIMNLSIILTSNLIFGSLMKGYSAFIFRPRTILAFGILLFTLMFIPTIVELSRMPENSLGGPFQAILIRLIFSGDVYIWLYGDNYISSISVESPIMLLFSDFFGMTRLLTWENLPVHPGLQIYQFLHPESDSIRGPNLRVDAFGLLFGNVFYGICMAALLGAVFGFFRAIMFRVRSSVFFLPAAFLFFQSPYFLVDPILAITAFDISIIAIVIMTVMIIIIGQEPFPQSLSVDILQQSTSETPDNNGLKV